MLKISFRNDMRRYFIFIILICSLLCICGCKANIPGNSSQAFPTSKIRGEDAIITPSPTFPAVSANIEELEPLKENELADNQSVGFPKDIDECFSICSNVVKGKVVSITEFSHYTSFEGTDNEGSKYYSSLVVFDVQKNYGDKPLKYASNDIIRIEYHNSSYNYVDIKPKLVTGNDYILFISENEALNQENAGLFSKDYYEYAPYAILYENVAVLEKTSKGYNAGALMDLADGKELKSINEKPAVRSYSLEKIEKVIMDNVQNLRGLSFGELLDERVRKYGKI